MFSMKFLNRNLLLILGICVCVGGGGGVRMDIWLTSI